MVKRKGSEYAAWPLQASSGLSAVNSFIGTRGVSPWNRDLLMAGCNLRVHADPLWLRLEWLGYSKGLVDSSAVEFAQADERLAPLELEAIRRQAIRGATHRMAAAIDAENLQRQNLAQPK